MSSIKSRFASAVQWNFATSITTVIIQLLIIAILARLLKPSDFGLFAIANVVFVFAVHLTQPGMTTAIVREPELDREIVGSFVSLSIGVSMLVAVVCFVVAPLVALGAQPSDRLLTEHLVRIMSVTIFVSGISL